MATTTIVLTPAGDDGQDRVRALLALPASADMTEFLAIANCIIAAAVDCDPSLGVEPKLSTLRTWLAAHYYTTANPSWRSRSINGTSKTALVVSPGDSLAATRFGRQALTMDGLGCLRRTTTNRTKVGVTWLGTTGPNGTTRPPQ